MKEPKIEDGHYVKAQQAALLLLLETLKSSLPKAAEDLYSRLQKQVEKMPESEVAVAVLLTEYAMVLERGGAERLQ